MQEHRLVGTAAKNGISVQVIEHNGSLYLLRYSPSGVGRPENKELFKQLFTEAAKKIGWKRDGRTRSGWRKI